MSQETATVEIYLPQRRFRVHLAMHGFSRVSDLFNNMPGDFLSGDLKMIISASAREGFERSETSRELVVRKQDIRLVRPISEPDIPATLYPERALARAVFEVEEWQIVGNVHLVDRIRWVDFATAMSGRFVPVTRASVQFGEAASAMEYEFILVNGSRVSALYEAP